MAVRVKVIDELSSGRWLGVLVVGPRIMYLFGDDMWSRRSSGINPALMAPDGSCCTGKYDCRWNVEWYLGSRQVDSERLRVSQDKK